MSIVRVQWVFASCFGGIVWIFYVKLTEIRVAVVNKHLFARVGGGVARAK